MICRGGAAQAPWAPPSSRAGSSSSSSSSSRTRPWTWISAESWISNPVGRPLGTAGVGMTTRHIPTRCHLHPGLDPGLDLDLDPGLHPGTTAARARSWT